MKTKGKALAAALRKLARMIERREMNFVVSVFDDPKSPLTEEDYDRLNVVADGLCFDDYQAGGARDERVTFVCFAAAMADAGDL